MFCVFSVLLVAEPLKWNYLVGFALIACGAAFVFAPWQRGCGDLGDCPRWAGRQVSVSTRPRAMRMADARRDGDGQNLRRLIRMVLANRSLDLLV